MGYKFIELFNNFNFRKMIPKGPGVYFVIYENIITQPEFIDIKESNITINQLKAKWINKESVIYIGKAKSLRRRIRQYIKHGINYEKEPLNRKPHYGGRYIWHINNIRNSEKFRIDFEENNEPEKTEKELILNFCKNHNGLLPFANLKH